MTEGDIHGDPSRVGQQDPEMAKLASLLGFTREMRGYTEMAGKSTPAEVRHDLRMFCGIMEWMFQSWEVQPNSYLIDSGVVPGLITRANELEVSIPLGFSSYSKQDIEAGLAEGTPQADRRREELAEEYKRAAHEMVARKVLVAKLAEQDAFSSDVEKYMVDAFIRLGKLRMDTRHYETILNAPETFEGFMEYGEKVQEAIQAWRDIAEGKAVVEVPVYKNAEGDVRTDKRILPNPFSLPRNDGLEELCLYYISQRLGNRTSEGRDQRSKALRRLEDIDNLSAAVTGLLLFRHWDFDAYYAVGFKDHSGALSPEKILDLTPAELRSMQLETWGSDSAKAIHNAVRMASEWGNLGGQVRREHPRKAGAPYSFGCYPRLSTHALEIMTTQVEVVRVTDDSSETKVVEISIQDAVWGNGIYEDTKVDERSGKSVTTAYRYDTVSLGDIRWDDITLLGGVKLEKIIAVAEADANDIDRLAKKVLAFAMGPITDAYELQHKLQGFYAYKFMFEMFHGTNYLDMYQKIVQGDMLLAMNKGIDVGLGLMAKGFHLDDVTFGKLNNYIRVVFLGSLAAALSSSGAGDPIDRKPQVNIGYLPAESVVVLGKLLEAAMRTGFLPLDNKGRIQKGWEEICRQIARERLAPLPGEVRLSGKPLFTERELQRLEPLYPLGVNRK